MPPAKDNPNKTFVRVNNYPHLNLEELEKVWAKVYNEKPVDERERLTNELHGVSSRAVPESPQMIDAALIAFQEEVDRSVSDSLTQAYHRACEMNSTYVQSVPFRLKFLRAELFDVKKAVLRYFRNLDFLWDKFGDIALMRQLYMSDLNNDEMKFLKKGFIQILPFRDTVGRRIVAHLGSNGGTEFALETVERVATYIQYSIIGEDETSQLMGSITLHILNEDSIINLQSIGKNSVTRFFEAMPVRITGWHTCLSSSLRSRAIKALVLWFIQGDLRLLTRFHIGSQTECDYALRSFGIPTENIPRSSTGTIKNAYHKSYLKTRSLIEDRRKERAGGNYGLYYSSSSSQTAFPAIECPEINSFLVRRNGAAWNYPGNIRLRSFLGEKLIEQKRLQEDYVSSIAEEITKRNIQILYYDENFGWYNRITKKEEIQKQVLYIMREIRKRNRIKVSNNSMQLHLSATSMFQGLTSDRSLFLGDTSCCMRSLDDAIPIYTEADDYRKTKRMKSNTFHSQDK